MTLVFNLWASLTIKNIFLFTFYLMNDSIFLFCGRQGVVANNLRKIEKNRNKQKNSKKYRKKKIIENSDSNNYESSP